MYIGKESELVLNILLAKVFTKANLHYTVPVSRLPAKIHATTKEPISRTIISTFHFLLKVTAHLTIHPFPSPHR